ncbi:MAG TPA: rhomboid family intramembrane serine protease [Dehalococcoidia bacterium]|nr:rhomboid family intramembrane serine protease [Dehalococcoidia bacterium]
MPYTSYRRYAEAPILFLIALNVVLYIATLADPDLLYTLGLQPSTWMERPWTLITNLFVHGGLWHIAANMLTLYFFGRYLCMMVGDARFLTLYFLGGIAGNFLYILLSSSNAWVIGASGAIFAIAGALTVMAPKMRVFIFPIPAPLPLWVAVIGGFVVLSFFPNVAWQGHLGGLAIGLAAGYFFKSRKRNMPFFR